MPAGLIREAAVHRAELLGQEGQERRDGHRVTVGLGVERLRIKG